MTDVVVFIESNTTTAKLFIQAAREENLEPVMIVSSVERYSFISQMNIEYFITDTNCLPNITACIDKIKEKYNVRAIGSSSEYYIEIAARAAQKFGQPSPDPEAVKNCRDKAEQLKELSLCKGLYIPAYSVITNADEIISLASQFKFPVVVKPAFGSGSIGVKLCTDYNEMGNHCEKLLAQKTNERGMPLEQKVVIEEYIPGPEYSMESFNGEVIGITQKHVTQPPYFIETGHDFPCTIIPDKDTDDIKRSILNALQRLNLTYGPVHTEFKIVDNKPAIIEINPRLAGGFIPALIKLSYGTDLIKETIRLMAGMPVNTIAHNNKYASIRFIIPEKEGIFKRLDENLSKMPDDSLYEVNLYKEPGIFIKLNHDFRDRLGHIIMYGNNDNDVKLHIDRQKEKLKPVII